ncbi:hypothetical protein EON66_08130 [archaeon]|nr:MAG: hypothetical protein EON66_08130 [archaeon]
MCVYARARAQVRAGSGASKRTPTHYGEAATVTSVTVPAMQVTEPPSPAHTAQTVVTMHQSPVHAGHAPQLSQPTVPPASELPSAVTAAQAQEPADTEGRSIKLGLGDFVFYSVLVSRAALYDISTFAACFISVIMGLGSTLLLLSVFRKALPALPISIFFGVAFYFLTRLIITPMLAELSIHTMGM